MKNINNRTKILLLLVLALGFQGKSFAQCYETLGSSTNLFSTSFNRPNQIIVNNDLNTILFIHRQNVSLFGGNSGVYQYDISTDNGASWQVNQGNLNPNSANNTHAGRFPQVGLYNPAGNTNPANASLVYQGSTLVNGNDYNGYVTGSLLLDGTAVPTENYNQAGVDNTFISGGFCQSTPGTFWFIDAISNNNSNGEGIRILKGSYSAGDVTWAVNTELTPDFNLNSGRPQLFDWKMAFDPSGTKGWVVLLTHLNGGPEEKVYPVFYNTTDGGATWNGPVQLDPAAFSSVSALVSNPGCAKEIDITVDVNGDPHALVCVTTYRKDYYFNGGDPGILVDFTFDGNVWNANLVAHVGLINLDFVTSAPTYNRPRMSRSDDGTKIVYTWVETDRPFTPTWPDEVEVANFQPNLKAATYDVPTGTLGCPVIYSIKCPSILNGKMGQTSVSPILMEESGNFTVPVVVTAINADGDPMSPAQFHYLNDLSFSAADFTNAVTPAYPAITVDGTVPFCGNSGDVTLTASPGSSYLWNTGETTQSIHVEEGGNYWVVNPDNDFCLSSSNTVFLYAVQSFYAYISTFGIPVLCPGGAASLDISTLTWAALPSNSIFSWNTGDTTSFITVTEPGAYIPYIDGCPARDSLVVTAPGPGANDNRCNAQPLAFGTPAAINLACATAEADEPVPPLDLSFDPQSQDGWFDDSGAGAPVANNTAWFSFIAPSSGEVMIQTDGIDSQLALYSSSDNTCTGEMTLIAANDDGGTFDFDNFITLGSVINKPYCYEPGKQYFIQVDLPQYFFGFWEGTILLTANWNIPAITVNGDVLQSDAVDGNQWYDQNGPIPGATSQEYTATVSGTYYTIVTVDGCSTAPSNSINVTVTSVGTLGNDLAVNVYPNPISNEVIVEIPGNTKRLSYKIVNALGQMMSTGEVTEKVVVDTRPLASGVYCLMLNEGEKMVQIKLVKK